MKLNAPETWLPPTETLEREDPKLGRVRVRRWSGYHFQKSPTRGMERVRVEVLESKGSNRCCKPLWLVWLGETLPPLATLWANYLRRFVLEHGYRFAKQR